MVALYSPQGAVEVTLVHAVVASVESISVTCEAVLLSEAKTMETFP
jgi:hypothetical protein